MMELGGAFLQGLRRTGKKESKVWICILTLALLARYKWGTRLRKK